MGQFIFWMIMIALGGIWTTYATLQATDSWNKVHVRPKTAHDKQSSRVGQKGDNNIGIGNVQDSQLDTKQYKADGDLIGGNKYVFYMDEPKPSSDQKQDEVKGLLNPESDVGSKNADSSNLENKLNRVRAGITKGEGTQIAKMGEDQLAITRDFESANELYHKLRESVDRVFLTFHDKEKLLVRKATDVALNELYGQVMSKNPDFQKVLYELVLGSEGNQNFNVRIVSYVYAPSLRQHFSGVWIPETSNIFGLFLQRYANLSHGRVRFPSQTNVLTLERDGSLTLRDEQMKELTKTSISEISRTIESWIYDPEPWEAIQHQ